MFRFVFARCLHAVTKGTELPNLRHLPHIFNSLLATISCLYSLIDIAKTEQTGRDHKDVLLFIRHLSLSVLILIIASSSSSSSSSSSLTFCFKEKK